MSKSLNFCFKEHRKYVHGPDMFNSALKEIEESLPCKNFVMGISKITGNNLLLIPVSEKNNYDLPMVAKGSFYDKNGNRDAFLLLETAEVVSCVIEYDEDGIINNAVLDSTDDIQLSAPFTHSFMETITAMNKYLLQQKFEGEKGKWIVTRVKLNSYPFKEEVEKIHLRFRKNLGFKLTETEIFINQVPEKVGTINFSLI